MPIGTASLYATDRQEANKQRVMPDTHTPPPRRLEHLSGARLFVGDTVIAFRLLNEARHRIMSRVFGMPRERGCQFFRVS
jgi:hypothetical protein